MIKHVVLFKLKEGFTPASPQVISVIDEAAALGSRLPMVRDWIVGPDFGHRPISYDYALLATLDNREDLQAYTVHPLHQAVIKKMAEITTWIVCDLEV